MKIILTFTFSSTINRGRGRLFPNSLSRQPTHLASKSKNSRSVTLRQLSIHVNVGMNFWWSDVLPDQTSLDQGRDAGIWQPLQLNSAFELFCLNEEQGRHFNFFLGDQNFFYFSMPPDYWKIGKKQHFICSNLTLFIVPFFLSFFFFFFFSLFSFLFFSFLFFFFLFPWGRRPPSPHQMTPLMKKAELFIAISRCLITDAR